MKAARLAFIRGLVGALVMLLATGYAVAAGFEKGLEAYMQEDYSGAAKIWQQSADTGDGQSQLRLGQLYEEGLGVLQNYLLAHFYYSLAQGHRHPDGGPKRRALAVKMTGADLRKSAAMVDEWLEKKLLDRPPYPVTAASLLQAAAFGDGERIETLLRLGVDVNASDAAGWSPLSHAAFRNHIAAARMLLDKKAATGQPNKNGLTPLMLAVLRGHGEMVELLLASGADPVQRNAKGMSALNIAESTGQKAIAEKLAAKYEPSRDQIRELQQGLKSLGLDPGPVDGVMGRKTESALEALSKKTEIKLGRITPALIDQVSDLALEVDSRAQVLKRQRTQERWGAIATSVSRSWGSVWNQESKELAELAALEKCTKYSSKCKIRVATKRCAAVAAGPKGQGWNSSWSHKAAGDAAVKACLRIKGATSCTVLASVCADGRRK